VNEARLDDGHDTGCTPGRKYWHELGRERPAKWARYLERKSGRGRTLKRASKRTRCDQKKRARTSDAGPLVRKDPSTAGIMRNRRPQNEPRSVGHRRALGAPIELEWSIRCDRAP